MAMDTESTKGKGKVLNENDEEDDDKLDEDNPFNIHLNRYLSVLKENKM